MSIYLLFKLVHIIAVIIFMGNIYTGLFWMKQADKSQDPALIAFTMGTIIRSDRWFTIPAVIIITAAGISAALYINTPILRAGWIFWSIVFFTLSGIIFSAKLVPLQKRIYKLTGSKNNGEAGSGNYKALLRQWEIWGHIALLMPITALVMMVLKLPLQRGF